jgi:hypothetical protein
VGDCFRDTRVLALNSSCEENTEAERTGGAEGTEEAKALSFASCTVSRPASSKDASTSLTSCAGCQRDKVLWLDGFFTFTAFLIGECPFEETGANSSANSLDSFRSCDCTQPIASNADKETLQKLNELEEPKELKKQKLSLLLPVLFRGRPPQRLLQPL